MAKQTPRDDDTEAILRRRRFLIQSALAGAGIGALLAGCAPKPCLTVLQPPAEPTPRPCLAVVPPPQPSKPGPCLKVVPPKKPPRPGPCLSIRRP